MLAVRVRIKGFKLKSRLDALLRSNLQKGDSKRHGSVPSARYG